MQPMPRIYYYKSDKESDRAFIYAEISRLSYQSKAHAVEIYEMMHSREGREKANLWLSQFVLENGSKPPRAEKTELPESLKSRVERIKKLKRSSKYGEQFR